MFFRSSDPLQRFYRFITAAVPYNGHGQRFGQTFYDRFGVMGRIYQVDVIRTLIDQFEIDLAEACDVYAFTVIMVRKFEILAEGAF